MASGPTLFLIDGSNQMYRAYHAIRGLTRSDGKSTNATYGFITMLRKLLADHQPQYIAASFDLRGETFRSKVAADYKANRSPMPGDLAEQVPWVHEACEAMGVPIYTAEGYEADDVIGTLATKDAASGMLVTIVTHVDVPFELEKFRFRGADRERCYALFAKMEFRTLVPEFAPTAATVQKDYALVESADHLR